LNLSVVFGEDGESVGGGSFGSVVFAVFGLPLSEGLDDFSGSGEFRGFGLVHQVNG